MWYVIDAKTNCLITRCFSYYVADKVRRDYDGAVKLFHRV